LGRSLGVILFQDQVSHLHRIEAESMLPLSIVSQREIDASGAATAAELLAQLPQAAEFDTTETATGPNDARGDAVSLNLRGIGSGNTLVLLNGRRVAPHPISAGEVPRLSANINQIPLAAVQSIEVLRDGASAIYGSDAVAGVINTTLRRDVDAVVARIRYGNVTDGSMAETSASLLGGGQTPDQRTHWMGFVTVLDRASLGGSELRSHSKFRDLEVEFLARSRADMPRIIFRKPQ
jgi:outer membrane cobalamin receptor